MTEEQNHLETPGRVALWKNDSENPNAPTLKGHIYAHRNIPAGEKIAIAVWRNERGAEGAQYPVLTGRVSDVVARQETPTPPTPAPAAPADDFDDDIPF